MYAQRSHCVLGGGVARQSLLAGDHFNWRHIGTHTGRRGRFVVCRIVDLGIIMRRREIKRGRAQVKTEGGEEGFMDVRGALRGKDEHGNERAPGVHKPYSGVGPYAAEEGW